MAVNPVDRGVLILTSLADGEKHGYAIMNDVEKFAGVRLGPGTLYGALSRLEDAHLITALPSNDRRRPFRITAAGRLTLELELKAQATLALVGLTRLEAVE